MRVITLLVAWLIGWLSVGALSDGPRCAAQENQTLMGTIVLWRYPDAKIDGSTMADGATLKANGERSVASTVRKTVMTTPDSVGQVVDYYKQLFSSDADSTKAKPTNALAKDFPRSVAFHEDSTGRALSIHIISVNTTHTSTTLVISRAADEMETHIAWTQYQKH